LDWNAVIANVVEKQSVANAMTGVRLSFVAGLPLVLVIALYMFSRSPAHHFDRCVPPDISVDGCTDAINSGVQTPAAMATAYNNRGIAYAKQRMHARAIQDYD
jgi:hypothetical protein